ncbi:MAG: 2-(1,2-epoxy-1,2-dihydrophenyl)acetyl-CoA isomerase [Gammaproteobacteria bacterium]|jgi:2-(1,2-epoxy-1,2-dihydrophenyl)acetyl-CoA isomerase
MKNDEILYAVAHKIATITFNRPEARNAFGDTTRDRLEALLIEAESDEDVRCVIITGAGSAFAAGGDVKGMGELQTSDDTEVLVTRMQVAARVVLFIRAMKTPVIAAINGAAAGGALNLALACDIRYASESAIFSQSFVKIGLVPDWGGHHLLTQIVGAGRAMELMMLGEVIDSTAALRLGMVNDVFPSATFREQVLSRAQKLAAGPRDALAAIKQGVYAGCSESLADILAFEEATQVTAFLSDDAREGVRAFIEKRAPNFK